MKIFDLLRLCLDNLRRRKGRTALTVVGVMVGTCSIVVMVSLGVGINQTQMEMMASWGDLTQIQIMNHNNNANSEMPALDDAKIAEIQGIPKVLAATPVYQSQVLNSQIFAGKKEKYSTYGWNIYGMNAAAIEVMGYKLNEGEYFEAGLNNKKIPILVGQYTAYSFEDTTKSYRSSKRRVDRYLTDDSGNPKPPFFDMMKEKNYVLRTEKVDEKGK
ncbi:MAG: ABC transporter permease, partial [Oscillospiraceae bacterium]